MRCRNHLYDLTSTIGVCASCLTERLSVLIEAEQQLHNPPPPPPLLFPRSVSPRRFRQELEDADLKHQWMMMMPEQKFFSTPQFEITANEQKINTRSSSKFSIIKKLFKSKSQKILSEKHQKQDQGHEHVAGSISSPSPGWFPSLTRKSKSSRAAADQSPFPSVTTQSIRRRGVSPCRSSCDTPSGIHHHPWQPWKRTPTTASSRRGKSSPNVSGMLFGMSPLVRASPRCLWIQRSYTSESGYSGELKISSKVAMSPSPSLRSSRSRKLADFTILNRNR